MSRASCRSPSIIMNITKNVDARYTCIDFIVEIVNQRESYLMKSQITLYAMSGEENFAFTCEDHKETI